jgi:hypothetical protein
MPAVAAVLGNGGLNLPRGATFVARELLVAAGLQRDPAAPVRLRREMPLFRRGLRDRLREPEEAVKMPRAVTKAIEVGAGAKRDDQRAETVVRRGALFNRLAVSRCVVFCSSRVERTSITRLEAGHEHDGLPDRLGGPEKVAKMPRAVTRTIEGGARAKRGDQRAETVVRRGAQFSRIADLHCVVVYRLRAAPDRTAPSSTGRPRRVGAARPAPCSPS